MLLKHVKFLIRYHSSAYICINSIPYLHHPGRRLQPGIRPDHATQADANVDGQAEGPHGRRRGLPPRIPRQASHLRAHRKQPPSHVAVEDEGTGPGVDEPRRRNVLRRIPLRLAAHHSRLRNGPRLRLRDGPCLRRRRLPDVRRRSSVRQRHQQVGHKNYSTGLLAFHLVLGRILLPRNRLFSAIFKQKYRFFARN